MNKCVFMVTNYAVIHHFRRSALDTKNHIQYNQESKSRKED